MSEAEFKMLWLSAFHNADAKTAEEHADAFMEQNFSEAIYIQRHTNWQIIRSALVTAFKIAETRGKFPPSPGKNNEGENQAD